MPEPTIPPALSVDEWQRAIGEHFHDQTEPYIYPAQWDTGAIREERRHAVAALCLYGQSYGFTQEDVVFLRSIALDYQERYGDRIEDAFLADALATRIQALLPPPENAR